jgi:hypothetical protein
MHHQMQMIGKKLSKMRWTRFFLIEHGNYLSAPMAVCRCSGYRGIPVYLLVGHVIGPSSALGRINDPSYGEDPHKEAPREENDGGKR